LTLDDRPLFIESAVLSSLPLVLPIHNCHRDGVNCGP
jgi:hypothetical protein